MDKHNLDLTNQNPKWSASRFSSYLGCKNKYFLSYIANLQVSGRDAEVQTKGLAFHEIAEEMNSTITLEQLLEITNKKIDNFNYDKEKYPIEKAIPKFFMFWQEYVKPLEEKEFTYQKEIWINDILANSKITGAIDLLLINKETKEAVIFDYKTGQTAKIDGYENQLMLYAYAIKNQLNTTFDKIKTYLFFPLAGLKDDLSSEDLIRKSMMKSLKQLIYTEDQLDEMINQYKSIITESAITKWSEFDLETNATMDYGCTWCGFLGSRFCPTSQKQGFIFPRKGKIFQKGKENIDLKFPLLENIKNEDIDMKYILISGSRTFSNYKILKNILNKEINENKIILISGGAKGTDQLGEKWAKEHNFKIRQFIPDWDKKGKSAGILRNIEMFNIVKDKLNKKVIVFWDKESKGTKHMIDQCKDKVPLEIYDFNGNLMEI